MCRILGGHGDGERLRVRVADVLGGKADQPPGDVERILAGLEHPRHPVDRRVGIAVAHRLVQRGDEVVVLLTALVVEQRAPLDRLLELRQVEPADGRRRVDGRGGRRELEQVQRGARVAIREARDGRNRVVAGGDVHRAEPALPVGQGPAQDLLDHAPA